MFPTSTLTLNPLIPPTRIPICSPPRSLLVSTTESRRRTKNNSIKASVSTFVESIPVKTQSLYEILHVNQTASQLEIKTAYRSLAKLYHPDANARSDGQDFMEIHNAYETLSDPAARAVYDLSLETRMRQFGFSAGYCPTRRWETDQCW